MARNSSSKTASKSPVIRNITTRKGINTTHKEKHNAKSKNGECPNDEEAIKHGNIQEIMGVPPFNMSDVEGEDNAQSIPENEMETVDKEGEWFTVHGQNIEKLVEEDETELLEFEPEDVQEDIDFRNQAVYGFILGSNPPITVVEGFLRRIWKQHDIDSICFMPTGVFLVRFKQKEMQ
ncbi:hypothetical protein vseg_015234 [Gypsophila vaccaria]